MCMPIQERCIIAHFQKEWKPGTKMGTRLIMGSFGGTGAFVFKLVRPQTIPTIMSMGQ